ncbi:SusE domain-containing protein [Dysgonomonas sp. 511]|uniref:SusE domain-containing protein n=1 Tax=Dysgonomonas sp. 511 TaxID=2302930 RepID=UPI0013D8D3F0|nr:SusE domain-containing protein [Dysgonomonas sp. 511]NDV79173.1 hypothetical protein [Dysgonomonas sp. 511]
MEKLFRIRKSFIKLACILLVPCLFAACEDEIDNAYTKNQYNLELTTSTGHIILDENTPEDIALVLNWTPATDLGLDYKPTYTYEVDLVNNKNNTGSVIKEYEDDFIFKRSYTHKDLQDLLIDHWGQPTSTTMTLQFRVTATYGGPKLVLPEISTITVKIKTYGPLQFAADRLFMAGDALGDEVEIFKKNGSETLFMWEGFLAKGKINFPVIYSEDFKVTTIAPVAGDQTIVPDAMDADIMENAQAGSWIVDEAGEYRVSVNTATKTVTIIAMGDILEFDKIYLAGTAVGNIGIEMTQTLEDENCYAFYGQLNAGKLYLPMLFEEKKEKSLVPAGSSQEISDGNAVVFGQADTDVAAETKYWNIPSAGLYRIVVNADTKMITIYSQATDPQPKLITGHKDTSSGTTVLEDVYITNLWMWGGFNNWTGDGSSATERGFSEKYKLTPSLANPYIFVYKGDVLPREKESGGVKFCITNKMSNVYAFSSASTRGVFLDVVHGGSYTLYEGQLDNRYSYFRIPENTNYIMVDIEKLVIVFDNKQ